MRVRLWGAAPGRKTAAPGRNAGGFIRVIGFVGCFGIGNTLGQRDEFALQKLRFNTPTGEQSVASYILLARLYFGSGVSTAINSNSVLFAVALGLVRCETPCDEVPTHLVHSNDCSVHPKRDVKERRRGERVGAEREAGRETGWEVLQRFRAQRPRCRQSGAMQCCKEMRKCGQGLPRAQSGHISKANASPKTRNGKILGST